MNYCNILEAGAARLSTALPALTSLARLELNVNGLKGAKGSIALLQAKTIVPCYLVLILARKY
jgi:hypothetical protein